MMVCLIQKNRKIGVLTVRVAGEKIKTARKRKNYRKLNWQKEFVHKQQLVTLKTKMCVTV